MWRRYTLLVVERDSILRSHMIIVEFGKELCTSLLRRLITHLKIIVGRVVVVILAEAGLISLLLAVSTISEVLLEGFIALVTCKEISGAPLSMRCSIPPHVCCIEICRRQVRVSHCYRLMKAT